MKVVRLSELLIGRLYSLENNLGIHLLVADSSPGQQSGRNDVNDAIGNRTLDIPAFSAVSQPTASPRAENRKLSHCCTVYHKSHIDWFDRLFFKSYIKIYFVLHCEQNRSPLQRLVTVLFREIRAIGMCTEDRMKCMNTLCAPKAKCCSRWHE